VTEEDDCFKTFAGIETLDGHKFVVLGLGLDAKRLERMIRNKDYAMDTIKVLSYYFETKAAEDMLNELKRED
jgi:hypothetical protein